MSTSLVTCARAARRAFTLIELMVVLIIIAVVISIVLPALRLARIATRTTTTRAMMTNITNAVGSYVNDNKRLPGYFTARQMGDTGNQGQGFTALQNVMLELAGFTQGLTMIGPGTAAADQVGIDLTMLGVGGQSTSKAYYIPEARHWVAQNQTPGVSQVAAANNYNLPSVVDDFGNPVLAWVMDDTAVGQITQESNFAKAWVTGPNDASARFYWVPNAAFLRSTSLGQRGYDQTDQASGSMISGAGAANPPNIDKSLCGLLGSPSYPYRPQPPTGQAPTVPAAARAPFILQSAGGDGVFVGKRDRGAKQFTNQWIDYQMSFVNKAGGSEGNTADIYTDKDGKRAIIDVVAKFDDSIATGGN